MNRYGPWKGGMARLAERRNTMFEDIQESAKVIQGPIGCK